MTCYVQCDLCIILLLSWYKEKRVAETCSYQFGHGCDELQQQSYNHEGKNKRIATVATLTLYINRK